MTVRLVDKLFVVPGFYMPGTKNEDPYFNETTLVVQCTDGTIWTKPIDSHDPDSWFQQPFIPTED